MTSKAVACAFPAQSALPAYLAGFNFTDSFKVDLSRSGLTIQQIYLAIFAHHPWWAKALLLLRTRIVSLFGIGGPTARQMADVEIKDSYAVGEKIALFTLMAQDLDEIIAGGDDRHLDFRVSVLRLRGSNPGEVVVTTVVKTHNLFGRVYLALITPFHKFGVKHLLSTAATLRRL
jgi:hypothetical protein